MANVEKDDLDFETKRIKLIDSSPSKEAIDDTHPELNHTTSMTCFHLRPKKFIDRSLESVVNIAEFSKEMLAIDGLAESLESLKQNNSHLPPVDRSNQYPKVVFLGTGSCIPNKTRNVSAILVHTTYV